MSLFGIKIQKDCKAPFNTSWDIKRWAMNARKMPEDWKMLSHGISDIGSGTFLKSF